MNPLRTEVGQPPVPLDYQQPAPAPLAVEPWRDVQPSDYLFAVVMVAAPYVLTLLGALVAWSLAE